LSASIAALKYGLGENWKYGNKRDGPIKRFFFSEKMKKKKIFFFFIFNQQSLTPAETNRFRSNKCRMIV